MLQLSLESRIRQTTIREQVGKVFAGLLIAPGGMVRVSNLCKGATMTGFFDLGEYRSTPPELCPDIILKKRKPSFGEDKNLPIAGS